MSLVQKKCVPCEGGVPRLGAPEIALLMPEINGWSLLEDNRKLSKRFVHDDFKQAMSFINKMADLAESEGHHPDFAVRYSVVDVTLWTHAIGGLSENDFILAAKLDQMVATKASKA